MNEIVISDPYCLAKIERLAKAAGVSAEEYAANFLKLLVEKAYNRAQLGDTHPLASA